MLMTAVAGVKSVVQIGAQSGSYNANVTAADGAQRCYTVPSYSSGALHQVVVGLGEEGPLQSTKMYFYRYGRLGMRMQRFCGHNAPLLLAA